MSAYETSSTPQTDISELEKDGTIRISEEVISSIAIKAISEIETVSPATPDFLTGIRLGRKTVNGVRVNISYETKVPEIIVDAYVSVRYGLRLPDICWDLQELVKSRIEKAVGFSVKAVNVYVCKIDFSHVDRQESSPVKQQCITRP